MVAKIRRQGIREETGEVGRQIRPAGPEGMVDTMGRPHDSDNFAEEKLVRFMERKVNTIVTRDWSNC